MADVLELVPLRARQAESAIGVLESALEEAEDGQISAICVCIVRPDGSANAYTSDTDQAAALLGSITLAQVRMVHVLDNVLKGE